MTRFALGQLVATPGALAAMERSGQGPMDFLSRHAHGDWGEIGAEDWRANDRALVDGARLLAGPATASSRGRSWEQIVQSQQHCCQLGLIVMAKHKGTIWLGDVAPEPQPAHNQSQWPQQR